MWTLASCDDREYDISPIHARLYTETSCMHAEHLVYDFRETAASYGMVYYVPEVQEREKTTTQRVTKQDSRSAGAAAAVG